MWVLNAIGTVGFGNAMEATGHMALNCTGYYCIDRVDGFSFDTLSRRSPTFGRDTGWMTSVPDRRYFIKIDWQDKD
jgi:hypothetical protein